MRPALDLMERPALWADLQTSAGRTCDIMSPIFKIVPLFIDRNFLKLYPFLLSQSTSMHVIKYIFSQRNNARVNRKGYCQFLQSLFNTEGLQGRFNLELFIVQISYTQLQVFFSCHVKTSNPLYFLATAAQNSGLIII